MMWAVEFTEWQGFEIVQQFVVGVEADGADEAAAIAWRTAYEHGLDLVNHYVTDVEGVA